MNNVKKVVISIVLVIALTAVIGYTIRNKSVSKPPSSESNPIVIGSILPLTGDYLSVYGVSIKNAINLAADESGANVKVIFEDEHGCTPADAVSAAQKLISIDKVKNIVGTMCSGSSLAILPISEENKVVVISPSATSKNLTGKGQYFLRTIASDADNSKALAKYASEKGYKKGAILVNSAQDSLVSQKDDIKTTFVDLGGQLVAEESYIASSNKDFRSQLTKIWSSKPDVIFVSALPDDLALILKQANTLGITSVIIDTDTSAGTQQLIDLAGKLSNGLIFPFNPVPTNKQYTDFVTAYKSKYGEDPSAYAAEGYDAMALMIKAILASKNGASDDVKKQLLQIGQGYEGASGVISFGSNGDVEKPINIMMYEDGKPIKAE